MKRILVVWAALACTPFAGFAQSGVSWTKAFEDYVHAHGANGDFTGNILVSQKGKVVFEKSYGFASSTFGVRNGPSTRFVVASVTKTFTAAAIILLRDEGKLKIEDSISRFFPDFPRADEIKIRHLLAHQSGLQNPEL